MVDSIGVRISSEDFYPVWKPSDQKTRRVVLSPSPSAQLYSLGVYRSLNEDETELAEIANFIFEKPVGQWEILISCDDEDNLYLYVKSDTGEEQKQQLDFSNLPSLSIWHRKAGEVLDDSAFADYQTLLPQFVGEEVAPNPEVTDEAIKLPLEEKEDNFLDSALSDYLKDNLEPFSSPVEESSLEEEESPLFSLSEEKEEGSPLLLEESAPEDRGVDESLLKDFSENEIPEISSEKEEEMPLAGEREDFVDSSLSFDEADQPQEVQTQSFEVAPENQEATESVEELKEAFSLDLDSQIVEDPVFFEHEKEEPFVYEQSEFDLQALSSIDSPFTEKLEGEEEEIFGSAPQTQEVVGSLEELISEDWHVNSSSESKEEEIFSPSPEIELDLELLSPASQKEEELAPSLNLPLDQDSFQDFLSGLGDEPLFANQESSGKQETLEEALPWQLKEESELSAEESKEETEKALIDLDLEIVSEGELGADSLPGDPFKDDVLKTLALELEAPLEEKQQEEDSLGLNNWEMPLVQEDPSLEEEEALVERATPEEVEDFQSLPEETQEEVAQESPADFDLNADFNLESMLSEDFSLDGLETPKTPSSEEKEEETLEGDEAETSVPLAEFPDQGKESMPQAFSFLDEDNSVDFIADEKAEEPIVGETAPLAWNDLEEGDQDFLETLSSDNLGGFLPHGHLQEQHLDEDIQTALRETVKSFEGDEKESKPKESEKESPFRSMLLSGTLASVAVFTFIVGTLFFYQNMAGLERPALRNQNMQLRQNTHFQQAQKTWHNPDVDREVEKFKGTLSSFEKVFKP